MKEGRHKNLYAIPFRHCISRKVQGRLVGWYSWKGTDYKGLGGNFGVLETFYTLIEVVVRMYVMLYLSEAGRKVNATHKVLMILHNTGRCMHRVKEYEF